MTHELTTALSTLYQLFDVPADRIVASADLRERFCHELRSRVNDTTLLDDTIMRALLRLRKSADLPRLRR